MKLTSIFFLGLGMTAAMASGDSYLRANASSRQLRNSNQSSGEILHVMQRALGVFHLPHPSSSGGSGGGSSGGGGGGDDRPATQESEEEKSSWYSGSSTSSSAASGGADGADNASENSDSDVEDGIQEQYLANEYNGGGAGNAHNAGGSSAANVWPFLAAALVVGVVAAALVTLKKKHEEQADPDNRTALASSVKKGMRMFSKKRPAAADSPLYENDYVNEPSL